MFNITAATWSAIAALFSALSSFLIMLIHRRNLLEAARPELILDGWSRVAGGEGDTAHEVLGFTTLRNVGRGPALHTVINCFHKVANRPTAVMGTERLAIVAPNDSAAVQGRIVLWWKNVPTQDGVKFLPLVISILCWDSRGFRHETLYTLMAVEQLPTVDIANAVAPGVGFGTRTTKAQSVWMLKIRGRMARIPLVGRAFRDNDAR